MVIVTECSGCMADVHLSIRADSSGTARVGPDTAEVYYSETYGTDLIMWDCPACEYADSFDRTYRED